MKLRLACAAAAICLFPSSSNALSRCDFVLQWDAAQFQECISEYRKELDQLKAELNIAQMENRNTETAMCIIAMELQTKLPGADLALLLQTCRKPTKARPPTRKPGN